MPYGLVVGPVWRDGSVPVQRQSPGAERLPAQCTQLLCGGHVTVCSSHPHQALCTQILRQDTQSVAPLHPYAGTASFRKRPQPSYQTQTEHRVLRAGEYHTPSAGRYRVILIGYFWGEMLTIVKNVRLQMLTCGLLVIQSGLPGEQLHFKPTFCI